MDQGGGACTGCAAILRRPRCARPPQDDGGARFNGTLVMLRRLSVADRSPSMKTTIVLPILALGALMLTGGAAVHAMPVTALEQATPAATTQVYHRGRPHR